MGAVADVAPGWGVLPVCFVFFLLILLSGVSAYHNDQAQMLPVYQARHTPRLAMPPNWTQLPHFAAGQVFSPTLSDIILSDLTRCPLYRKGLVVDRAIPGGL